MKIWSTSVKKMFPFLLDRTYFVPPVYFNRVNHSPQLLTDRVHVKVQQPIIQLSDVRENEAQHRVLHTLSRLLRDRAEPMVVVSSLDFDNYLNHPRTSAIGRGNLRPSDKSRLSPILSNSLESCSDTVLLNEIENAMFLRPRNLEKDYQRGRFDILIINKNFGFVICEIKTVGDLLSSSFMSKTDEQNVIRKKIKKSLIQLDKEEDVLCRLIGDITGTQQPIKKVLIMPNLKRATLEDTLGQNFDLQHEFARCLGTDLTTALNRCIFSEQLPPVGRAWEMIDDIISELNDDWWKGIAVSEGQPMNADTYISVIASFCGPATSQQVQTAFQQRAEVNTLHDAVLETANCMEDYVLSQSQVDLVEKEDGSVFVTGPPGTGKSLMLVLKALRWLRQGHVVYVPLLWNGSEAVSFDIRRRILCHNPSLEDRIKLLPSRGSDFSDVLKTLQEAAHSDDSGSSAVPDEANTGDAWQRHFQEEKKQAVHVLSLDHTLPVVNGRKCHQDFPSDFEFMGSPIPRIVNGIADDLRENGRTDTLHMNSVNGNRASPDATTALSERVDGFERSSSTKTREIKIIVDEAPWFFPSFYQRLDKHVGGFSLWAASSFQSCRPKSVKEFPLTKNLRRPPVVVRELEQSPAYSTRAMLKYMPLDTGVLSSMPPPTDGPPVKRVDHSQHLQREENDIWNCRQCGVDVAGFLTGDLRIGAKIHGDEPGANRERLQFKDVLISGHLHLSKEIRDLVKNAASSLSALKEASNLMEVDDSVSENEESQEMTSQISAQIIPGFLLGLMEGGVPFDIILQGEEEINRLVFPNEGDLVHIAEPERVVGLERRVVVAVGTTDIRATYPRYVDPWFDVIACCTSQLIIVGGAERLIEEVFQDKLRLRKT